MKPHASLRLAAGTLAVAVFAAAVPAIGFGFSDVKPSSQFSEAINALKDRGVVEGYADGTFGENNLVNRAEFLKIVLGSRLSVSGEELGEGSSCFDDVDADDWFAAWVCKAKSEGIVSGYSGGDFKPEQNINFVEASKILALAFQQQGNGGNVWYEQYVRALEDSKAIPTSIVALDKPVTRGEMAEMMWRLTEGITDRPTKGYLNVKHPELAVNTASDDLQVAKSCRDLQAFAGEGQGGYYGDDLYRGRGMMMEGVAADSAAKMSNDAEQASMPTTGGSSGGGDFSSTNVQVEGVDEGDIVKTDGTYLFIAGQSHGSKVKIVKAVPGNDMRHVATIDLTAEGSMPQELYLDGDRLTIVSNSWFRPNVDPVIEDSGIMDSFAPEMGAKRSMMYPGYYGHTLTEVRIYDVSDHANPTLQRKVTFDGNRVSTRRIEDKLYLVMNRNLWWGGYPMPLANVKTSAVTETDVGIPTFSDTVTGAKDVAVTRCAGVSILPHVPQPEYMIVAVVPLEGKGEVKRELVVGSAQNIYASLKNLYVATPRWNYVWDGRGGNNSTTQLYRFEFTADGADLKSQGSVPGTILNQFSMDEYGESFRIATTKQATWTGDGKELPSTNNLYVLNKSLELVGEIEDIAPGESIYSVRFMGDRTYMVTFKQVDPFFVIDTSDPRNPKILGKLKIPGYSDYLHPYDATHVIGFGKEVDESIGKDKVHSEGAVYYTAVLGMKVSMFDVSDVANPKEMFKTVIGDRGTESPLLHDHHALLFDKERNLLAFPVTVMSLPAGKTAADESAYPTPTFQGAYVYDISLKGLNLRGKVSHYGEDAYLKAGDSWYPYGNDVERIVRIEDKLYTISPTQVQSHTEKDVKQVGKVEL